jgi:hypothetical protein
MTSISRASTLKLLCAVTVATAALLMTTPVVLAEPLGSHVMIGDRVCAGDLRLDRSTADYHACVASFDRILFQSSVMPGGYPDPAADNPAAR